MAKAKKHVINLSKRKLSNQEYILLAKGLKFIPAPMAKFAKQNLLKDFDEFSAADIFMNKMTLRFTPSESKVDINHLSPVIPLKII